MMVFFSRYLGGTHGTAKSARDFLRALLVNSDQVSVVAPCREMFSDRLCGHHLSAPTWFDLPQRIAGFPRSWKKFRRWLNNLRVRRRLLQLREAKLIIVNGWASFAHWETVRGLFTGKQVLIVRESPRHFAGQDRAGGHPDLAAGLASFDHLIFVSERVCSEWLQAPELGDIHFSVLPNCCEEEEVSQVAEQNRSLLRQEFGFLSDDFVVLCPGTIEHRKGQDLLLDAIPELSIAIPGLRVIFVGDPVTSWGTALSASAAGRFPDQKVSFWAARPSILDLLHSSDLLVFPSRAEALPRTILEAMAMKTPVVASDVDGIPELVVDGVTGLLFPSGNKDCLVRAVLRAYHEPEFVAGMRDAGCDRYWNNFSRSHQFARLAHILAELSAEQVED